MKLEDIKIYNKDFKLLAIIPDFVSSNWELKFSGYGCGEIEFERDDEIVSVLYENEYLFLVQNDIQAIVTGYKIGKRCTVFARTLEWFLTKFVTKEFIIGQNLSETVENILASLPESFGLEFCGIDDVYDMSTYTFTKAKDIYTAIIECIGEKNVGFSFRADFMSKTFKFSLLNISENPDVLMCDEYRTSYDSEHTHHIQDKASGAVYYHDITYEGRWNPKTNEPYLYVTGDNFGKYYVVSEDGERFGLTLSKDDVILCSNTDGTWEKATEAKPFLAEIPPDDDGIFSWSVFLDANNNEEALNELSHKKTIDMLTAKTKLAYGIDYRLGDVIKTKFYGRNKSITVKKIVTEVHLWTEYNDSGESPVMKDLEEDENGV